MIEYTYTYEIYGFDCFAEPVQTLFFYNVASLIRHLSLNDYCVVAYHPCDVCASSPLPTSIAFHGIFTGTSFYPADTAVDPIFFIPEYCGKCPWCDIAYGCESVTNISEYSPCYACNNCYVPGYCHYLIFQDIGIEEILHINIKTTVFDEYG